MLGLIFLAVPVIVYDRFREADETQKTLLLRSVREQGRVMRQALAPLLADSEHPALPQLGRALARFADDVTNVKLLFAPADRPGFYYVASWPAVSSAQLDAEREELQQRGRARPPRRDLRGRAAVRAALSARPTAMTRSSPRSRRSGRPPAAGRW